MRFHSALTAAFAFVLAGSSQATLQQGAKAPDFTTRGAQAGKVFKLHLAQQLKKGPVVLYFFPAAFTSGCNAEAHAFAEAINDFHAAGATVIGMSTDPVDTLARFSTEKCAGQFPVASAGPGVVQAYDVLLPRTIPGPDGKPRSFASRTSYVIGRDGRISFVLSDMNPTEHVTTTLAAVRQLSAPAMH